MNRLTVIAATVLGLTACSMPPHYEYVWQASNVEQFHRDEVQCRQYAFQAMQAAGSHYEGDVDLYTSDCLLQLGYVRRAQKVTP